jgi:hypothetical protein
MKTVGQRNLKLLGGQAFFSQGPCDVDLWPGDLKIKKTPTPQKLIKDPPFVKIILTTKITR